MPRRRHQPGLWPPVGRTPLVDRQERALGVRQQGMPFRTQLAGGQPVLKGWIGVEQAIRLAVVGVQVAIDVDRGDQRPLVVDDRLPLHDAGDDHRLVDGQSLCGDGLPDLGRELGPELGEQPFDDLAWRRVRAADLVFERLGGMYPSSERPAGRSFRKSNWFRRSAGGAWRMAANSSRFIVISLPPNAATTSSSRSPSTRVTLVVGPNGTPCSAATISDGRSLGDRVIGAEVERPLPAGGDDRVLKGDLAADQALVE